MFNDESFALKEHIYSYVKELADLELPSEQDPCDVFKSLLWDRCSPKRPDVVAALDGVIQSDGFRGDKGLQFFNRCYYTICNTWHYKVERRAYLEKVIGDLKKLPEPSAHDPLTRDLRRRFHAFKESEYQDYLLRQLRLGGYEGFERVNRQNKGTISDYLPDYFCLYRSTTQTKDIDELESNIVNPDTDNDVRSGIIQKQMFRLRETYDALYAYRQTKVNPTRIPDQEFARAWRFYHPNRLNGFGVRAKNFKDSLKPEMTFSGSKSIIMDYLMQPAMELPIQKRIRYGIQNAFDTFVTDIGLIGGMLILAFERALDSFFLPAFNDANIMKFRLMIENIGSMRMVSILLNLVMGAPMARFNLEKKLGYLYCRYEDNKIEAEAWLVDFLEHINMALAMNARQLHYHF